MLRHENEKSMCGKLKKYYFIMTTSAHICLRFKVTGWIMGMVKRGEINKYRSVSSDFLSLFELKTGIARFPDEEIFKTAKEFLFMS